MKEAQSKSKLLVASATVLAAIANVYAAEQPNTQTAPVPPEPAEQQSAGSKISHWFNDTFPDVITKGKVNLNVRLRYEYANQEMMDVSNAFTVRTRLGYTTGDLYGFKGMLEMENVTAISGKNNYNSAGQNAGALNKTVVADPETTELNRGWLSYSRWKSTVKGGRERINLDNQRYIGSVGWRQNEQTFDGVSLGTSYIKDVTFFYSWISRVNRVLGHDHPQGRWGSDSHVINGSYTPNPWAKLTGYTYLLDLEGSPANSSDTFGGALTGSGQICDCGLSLGYRGEFAYQTSSPRNPTSYNAEYYHLAADVKYDRFSVGAGYEVLGSDLGNKGFGTPLATLHAFNGWADVFLNTPAQGLRDLYAWIGINLPGNVPLKFVYHRFTSDSGGHTYGDEYDAVVSKKFGKYWTLLAKLAVYDEREENLGFNNNGRVKGWVQGAFDY